MDDDVLGFDRGEAIARKLPDSLGKARGIRWEFQVGAILVDQHVEVADTEQIAALSDDRVAAAQFVAQHIGQLVGHAGFQLQPDHPPAPASLDRIGEIADEVLRLLLDLDVAVAQHAEGRRAVDDIAGEEQPREAAQDRLDRDITRALARQPHETRHGGGDHHQFANRLLIRHAGQVEDHRQTLVGNERKGMRGVERLGRQDRKNLLADMGFEPAIGLRIDRVAAQDEDARLVEQVAQVTPHLLLAGHQPVRLGNDAVQLLPGGQPVDRALLDILRLLSLQPGDAHHEEFIEVRPRDRQEAQPFEQRMRRIARLLQHAAIERQPGEFAVEIALAAVRREMIVVRLGHLRDMGGTGHISRSDCVQGSARRPAVIRVDRARAMDRRARRSIAPWSSISTARMTER